MGSNSAEPSDSLLSRGELLRRAAVGGAALTIPSFLGTSGASAFASRTFSSAEEALARRYGVAIPTVNVRFGMEPYGDHNIYAIGMKRAWFKELGINIGPGQFGARVPSDQVVPQLVNNQLDVVTQYGSFEVQSMGHAPQVKQFTISDTYVGIYMLAPPKSGTKTVSQLVKRGVPFNTAMKQAIVQLKGKRVALDSTGAHRQFFNTIFDLGGISFNDVNLVTVDDPKMVLLGRSGQIDFGSPAGAVQNVELLQDGWYPIVSVEDLIRGLPKGDPRGAGTVGHTGLATTTDYFSKNFNTCLRLASVMYRIIDAVAADIKNNTTGAIALEVPVVNSAAGANLTAKGLATVFKTLDPMLTFEQQRSVWLNRNDPFNYWNVYTPQVEAAKKGGVIPAGQNLTPDDAFIGKKVYTALAGYKGRYEQLAPRAKALKGDRAKLARRAATLYKNRAYLDAFQYMSAAVKG